MLAPMEIDTTWGVCQKRARHKRWWVGNGRKCIQPTKGGLSNCDGRFFIYVGRRARRRRSSQHIEV